MVRSNGGARGRKDGSAGSHRRSTLGKKAVGLAVLATIAGGLAGCVTAPFGQPAEPASATAEGIGYRQARFEEMASVREWRDCRDQAFDLDRAATGPGAAQRYLASAQLLERCEADLGSAARAVAREERMRAYAVAVQNHLRGGDVDAARKALATFEEAFPDADLYLSDGSSFIDSMTVLLSADTATLSRANVGDAVRAEVIRLAEWRDR